MAMFDSNIDYTKFIQFNGGTLRVATFVEIRDALVRRYREIFGNDIDVSTASADGQYINEVALIINNIVSTFAYAFDQLDPAVATGKYLDILCSYNNIQRINQSASVAEVYIYNSSQNVIQPESLLFVDRGGQTWTWINGKATDGTLLTKFEPGKATLIQEVTCDTMGAIQAQGAKFIDANGHETDNLADNDWNRQCPGWIYKFVDASPLKVWQYQDAIIGNEEETDEALRSRRYQLLGNRSVSVLEGLQGSLLNISGIKNVFIINNPTGEDMALTAPVNDGTNVLAHSIYIVLRYKNGVNIEKSLLGKLIYNKLTPGIATTPTGYNSANTPPFSESTPGFQKYIIQRTAQIAYTIYWKLAQRASPTIVINFNYNASNYDLPTDSSNNVITSAHDAQTDVEKAMVNNLKTYIDDIDINDYMQPSGLLNIVQQSDRQKQGISTFFVSNATINSSGNNYPANLSYFAYNTYKFTYNTTTHVGTLTISWVNPE